MVPLPSIRPARQPVNFGVYDNSPSRLDSPSPARQPADSRAYEDVVSRLGSRSPTSPPVDCVYGNLNLVDRFHRSSSDHQPVELAPIQETILERQEGEGSVIQTEYVLCHEVLQHVAQNLHDNDLPVGAEWLEQQIGDIWTPLIVCTTSSTFYRILKYWKSACYRDESIPEKGGRLVRGIFRTYEDGSRFGYHTAEISDEMAYRALSHYDYFDDQEEAQEEVEDDVGAEVQVDTDSMTVDGDHEDATDLEEYELLDQYQQQDQDRYEDEEIYDNTERQDTPANTITISSSHQTPTPRLPSPSDHTYTPIPTTNTITISSSHQTPTPRLPSPSDHADTPIPTTEYEDADDSFDDNDSAVSLSFSATITLGGVKQTISFDPDDRAAAMQRIDEYIRFCRSGHNPQVIDYNAFMAVRNFTLARYRCSRSRR